MTIRNRSTVLKPEGLLADRPGARARADRASRRSGSVGEEARHEFGRRRRWRCPARWSPWRWMPACDLAALFGSDEAAERVRASKALSFVRRVAEDCTDLCPGAVEDRAPFFPCPGQLPPPGAFALEVLEGDLEPFGIFFDALDDEAAGIEDARVDVVGDRRRIVRA